MAQSKAFVDASHSLNELSHALALLESENSSLRGAVDGFTSENAKLRKYAKLMHGHIKGCCDVCDEYYCSSWDEDNECCVFDSYMRELGIEV